MDFKVKEETLQKVLNYLALRPFQEVSQLIAEIQQVTPIQEDVVEDVKLKSVK